MSLVSVSTLKVRLSLGSEALFAAHPKETHNASAFTPLSPICQFSFWMWPVRKHSKDLSQSDVVCNRGRINCVQAPPRASDCKLCHMQMAVSGAIHPQLLARVGIGAHYLLALTAPTRSSSELLSSCGWLQKLPPSELAASGRRKKGFVCEGGC